MAIYKFYSGTLTEENDSDTLDVNTNLGRDARSGYIKNTGDEDMTFALKFARDADFGDNITLAPGETHGLGREFSQTDMIGRTYIKQIKINRATANTTYKVYVD